jgi:hypothetical protein
LADEASDAADHRWDHLGDPQRPALAADGLLRTVYKVAALMIDAMPPAAVLLGHRG